MWFSRLNRRISHSEARSLLRRVFANCTAANPPPTMTTLIGFNFLLPMAGCDVNPAFLPAHAHPLQQGGERHFDVLVQHRRQGILRISETCKFCSKWLTEWRRA